MTKPLLVFLAVVLFAPVRSLEAATIESPLTIRFEGIVEKATQASEVGAPFTVDLTILGGLTQLHSQTDHGVTRTDLRFDYEMEVHSSDWIHGEVGVHDGVVTISQDADSRQWKSLLFDIPFLNDISFLAVSTNSIETQSIDLQGLRLFFADADSADGTLLIAPAFQGSFTSVYAVPEPSGLALVLGTSTVGLLLRRRRRHRTS